MTPFALLLALACGPKSTPSSAEAPPPPAPATEAAPAAAQPAQVGQPAPAFTLSDTEGKAHTLADYAGKTVVLEWFNPDCPFVKYAHGPGGPLASQPAAAIEQGVVWLAVNSGAAGKQGAGLERNVAARTEYAMAYPVLMDESGAVGKLYGARTTPHLYIIDPGGVLVYAGALDNAPLGEAEGGTRTDHVSAALAALAGGQPLPVAETKPYGCSVKY